MESATAMEASVEAKPMNTATVPVNNRKTGPQFMLQLVGPVVISDEESKLSG